MFSDVLNILALSVASAASPVIFAIALSLLSGKDRPMERTAALLAGGAVVALLLALLGIDLGDGELSLTGTDFGESNLDFFFGAVMVVLGTYGFVSKPSGEKRQAKPHGLLKIFIIGLLINATNFDAVILNFNAIRDTAQAGVSPIVKLILFLVAGAFFLSPVLLPLCVYAFYPQKAKEALEPVGEIMRKYGQVFSSAILFLFGAYFVLRSGVLPV